MDWEDYHADPHTLILAMPDSGYLVYVWRKGTLVRKRVNKGEGAEQALPVGSGEATVQFVRAPDSKLISLRIDSVRKGKPLPGQTLEVTAALAGDWR